MTLAYDWRLLCLVLASFFVVQFAISILIRVNATRLICVADGLSPKAAAHFILALRTSPWLAGFVAALGLCLPSYLWFEPELAEEPVGAVCLFAAALGMLICTDAFVQAMRAIVVSTRFHRECRKAGMPATNLQQHPPLLVIPSSQPLLALSGFFRPSVFVSESVLGVLSDEELSAVLRHERAHAAAWDNLKRLVLSVMPQARWIKSAALERAWNRYAEMAADDAAVQGDAARSIALASALVRVARLGAFREPSPHAVSFLGDGSELAARVNRLLAPTAESLRGWSDTSRYLMASILVLSACVLPFVLRPATFQYVQSVLEQMIR